MIKILPRCMKRQDLCMRCGFMLVLRVRIMALPCKKCAKVNGILLEGEK